MKRNAFSFVDLLVVIAIIVGVIFLLFPSLLQNKRKAIEIHCGNNVKQLALVNYYHSDVYGENLNYGNYQDDSNVWNKKGVWLGSLIAEDRIQNEKILTCPAAKPGIRIKTGQDIQGTADTSWVRWSAENDKNAQMYSSSYGYNGWLYTAGLKDGMFTGFDENFYLKSARIKYPEKTPVFFDCTWVDAWPMETDLPSKDLYSGRSYWERTNEMGRLTILRHGNINPRNAPQNFDYSESPLPGIINIGMSDGHVEAVQIENLWQLPWHRKWQTPTTRPQ